VLLDLSPGNISYAKSKASESGISLSDYIVGNAVDLSGFPVDQFDLVLVLGPLYYLDNTDDRQSCIAEAVRYAPASSERFVRQLSNATKITAFQLCDNSVTAACF